MVTAIGELTPAASPPQINWILLISRQGKVRLAKWFTTLNPKTKAKIVKDVTQLVLARRVSRRKREVVGERGERLTFCVPSRPRRRLECAISWNTKVSGRARDQL